jgi:hypothetical protein
VVHWHSFENFDVFRDRKAILYNKATILYQKIVVFIVYFANELILDKFQDMVKDAQSFRIVESQFPGQVFPFIIIFFFWFFYIF